MSNSMIYIKKVILENFQSHKYTELEFDKNLNVIVGPSDQGKSAIIRGIKWALYNEPTGDFFIREGETECSVTIVFSNNIKLKRYRSKTKNYYYLYDNNGEEIIFEGFGTKVPQEIIDKISFRKVLLDENNSNSINIGEQLESPFLLSEKSSTRANAIGRLVGVHIVDDALRDTLKDIRNLNIKKRNHEDNLEKLYTNLAQYDYLDNLIAISNRLKAIKEEIYGKQSKLSNLTQKLELLSKIKNEIELLNRYLAKFDNLDKLTDISQQLDDRINNFYYIYKKYETYNIVIKNIEYNKNLLTILKDLNKVEYNLEKLNVLSYKITKLINLSSKYSLVKENIMLNNNILNSLKNIDNIEKDINLITIKQEQYKKIIDLKVRFDDINKRISIGKIYIERLANIDSIMNIKDSINIKYERLKGLLEYKKEYDIYMNNITKAKESLIKSKKEMENLLEQYKAILSRIERCPLCLSTIDKEKIDNIINSYS